MQLAMPQHFPLLLKFLFPAEKLSVQVHPDDEAAQERGSHGEKQNAGTWHMPSLGLRLRWD